jgi:ribosome biogenesis protein BRX1
MASVFKAQRANAANAGVKDKGKRKADAADVDEEQPVTKKLKNKQRVLLLSSRGITHRMRHLMNDLEALLPHVKKGSRVVD